MVTLTVNSIITYECTRLTLEAFFVLAHLAPRTGSMGYRKRVISGGTDIATLLASVSDIFALPFFPVAGGR